MVLYHYTARQNLPTITENGLVHTVSFTCKKFEEFLHKSDDAVIDRRKCVFLTPHPNPLNESSEDIVRLEIDSDWVRSQEAYIANHALVDSIKQTLDEFDRIPEFCSFCKTRNTLYQNRNRYWASISEFPVGELYAESEIMVPRTIPPAYIETS